MILSEKYLVVILLLFFQSHSFGQTPWELVKDKNGIQVFTRINTVSSFKEFKATMTVEAKVSQFLTILYDIEGLPEWAYNVTESKLLKRPDDLSQTYYAVAKAPWPYKNRDGIYENTIHWSKDEGVLLVEIDMLEEKIELNENCVRMDGFGYWKVEKVSGEEVVINFQMQIDPGGSIKAWMANMFVSDSPYQTLMGLREALKKEKYKEVTYDFLLD